MGQELQLQAEQDTAKIAPKFVPTVVFNGVGGAFFCYVMFDYFCDLFSGIQSIRSR